MQLVEVLQEIKEQGVAIAFSADRLGNNEVSISSQETVRSVLQRLQGLEIIRYKLVNERIIVTKYEPIKFTFNGILKDAETGEYLIGANIHIEGTNLGTTTNGYGYYSLTMPEGTYEITVSHIGYTSHFAQIVLDKNIYLSLSMSSATVQLEEVQINSISDDFNISSSIPSINKIEISNAPGRIPYLLSEVDVIQNALLQPGISTVGEDANGFHVRGGRVDQNLVLLDEATIYNPNHIANVSIFNPEAVNDVRIFKGFIPPSYGGRTSSVVEVRQNEGNTQKVSYSGGIGLLSARGLVEGPITKGTSSFLVSARQSIINPSIDDFASTSVRRNRISFQDVNLKINSKPSTKDAFYLSGYFGNDRNTAGLSSIRNWGNSTANFRWNHLFSPQIFSNLSAFVSEYSYRVESAEEPGAFVSRSRIVNYSLKSDLTYSPNPNSAFNFGFASIFHRLKPGDREPFDTNATTNTISLDTEHGVESALYLSHEVGLGALQLHYGLRYSTLHNIGPEEVRVYAPDGPLNDTTVIDTLFFERNELVKLYQNAEPRVSVNWRINEATSLKAAYSKTAQYLHLISNTLAPAPTDIWKLSDTYIPPSVSHQYTLGVYKNFKKNMWESSAEVYYKDNLRSIAYKNGADLIFNENVETELIIGRGRAYGLELYAEKKYGKLTGWVSYTLSRSETRLEEDNERTFVLNNFDKTHDFSTTWVLQLSDRVSASGNFLISTGIPITLPSDKYLFENNIVPHFTERNKSRLPAYHRLDLSVKLRGKKFKKDGSARKNRDFWIFSIYNAYSRRNTNAYFFRASETNPGRAEIVQYSLFGTIIPSVAYNFKF